MGRTTVNRVELVAHAVTRPIAQLVCPACCCDSGSQRCHRLFQLRIGSRWWVVVVAFSMAWAGMATGDRGADARRHTRVEIPIFTGRHKPPPGLLADLA